jgi:hypothetical protein
MAVWCWVSDFLLKIYACDVPPAESDNVVAIEVHISPEHDLVVGHQGRDVHGPPNFYCVDFQTST